MREEKRPGCVVARTCDRLAGGSTEDEPSSPDWVMVLVRTRELEQRESAEKGKRQ